MRKIHLYGAMAKDGDVIEMEVETAAEAIQGLCANFPGLRAELPKQNWIIVRGDLQTGMMLEESMLATFRLGDADLHILPEVMGAKRGGALKIILGIGLTVFSFGTFGAVGFLSTKIAAGVSAMTWGNAIGALGVGLALSGVSSMLTPDKEEGDDTKGFLFSGIASTTGQGQAVPIIYGELIVPGVIVSAGIDADQLIPITDGASAIPEPVVPTMPTWPNGTPILVSRNGDDR